MPLSRREFMKLTAASAAVGLVGLSRKSARADGPPRARRVLIVAAEGGMRSTMAFNASPKVELNPWGLAGAAGAIKLGKVLASSPASVAFAAPSWPGAPTVPGIAEAAKSWAVVGACDHAPSQPRAGDHTDDGQRAGTGWYGKDGAPGILTVLNKFLGVSAPAPVAAVGDLGNTGGNVALASSEWQPYGPVLLDPQNMPSGTAGAADVTRPIEDLFDARLRARRRGLGRALIDRFLGTKKAMRTFGPVLTQAPLALGDPANYGAQVGGISNRMLLEAVGNLVTAGGAGMRDGLCVALGLRLLQVGAPAVLVCVGGGSFDTHSSEQETAPDLYTRFARYLAGIHFALGRIPDGNGTLLDSTLVFHTSEFGRTAGAAAGYVANDGSDHGDGNAPWRNQAHVVFGAGVKPKAIGPTDDDNQPLGGKPRSTQSLLATVCAAAGVPQDQVDALWPPQSPLYPDGPMLDLWS